MTKQTTADERLDWLLRFLQRDLTALRPGERLDLADDCDRLLQMRDPAVDLASVTPPNGYAFALAKMRGELPDVDYFDALVLDVQAALKAGVAKLEAKQTWQPFRDDGLTPVFTVEADNRVTRRYHGSYAAIMRASAVDLLVTSWPQIRRCRYAPCSVLFRPKENRQVYHDPKCSGLARQSRLPKRDYKQELANAVRRDRKKKTSPTKEKRR